MDPLSFKPEKSHHIEKAVYDPDKKIVHVTFKNGKTYPYVDVPQEAFTNWMKYRSAGEFFHGVIKRNYKLVK